MTIESAPSKDFSRLSLWACRLISIVAAVFPGRIILLALTASVINQGRVMVHIFDKYQEYSDILQVSNIGPQMLMNKPSSFVCADLILMSLFKN